MSHGDGGPTRRDVVKVAGATGLAGLAGCLGGDSSGDDNEQTDTEMSDGTNDGSNDQQSEDYPPLGNFPVQGSKVILGFNVPQSGPYASEGKDELRGYEMAVKHLNNGGGWVDDWDDLSGDGVLGKQVDYVTGDTATDADQAQKSARRMIQRDNALMVSGGSSSAVAIAVQELCQREKVTFMCCLTHSNDTTGKNCVRYSFREMFNAYMTGQALAPVVTEEYGDDLDFYQLYADYSWGKTQQASMKKFFEEAGWSQVDSVATPLGTKDYQSYLSEAANSGADALFLNHYGLDGANSLKGAIDAGMDQDMEIVMPLYNRPMAQAAGGAIEGIYGTVAWDAQIDNGPSNKFSSTFGSEYNGRTPSGPAQLAYAQTLQYAAAAERAGTFYPPEVIKQLEDYSYSSLGMGEETMRKCDHQAQRAVPVVKGLPESEQDSGTFYEIVNLTSRDDLGYGCSEGPAAECKLGSYE
ncbi:substrate-binding protein [Halorussus halophilus]|uniref:substrate-binding protein n=1 Tax=Halorussus halophilus TaxID=2650975 RepID=UPI001300D50A|nr:substrate-binding protein [Halorussus halophilus]